MEDVSKKLCGCVKTKTAFPVHEMANDCISLVIEHLQDHPFAAASDGRHESDYKLYLSNYFNVDLGVSNTVGDFQFWMEIPQEKV